MAAQEFDLIIVTPDKTLYEGKVQKCIAPGKLQDIAILPDHTPLYAELKEGDITATTDSGPQTFTIEGGIVRVRNNRASIIVGF